MSRPTIASLTTDLEAANAKVGELEAKAAAATELVSAPLDETVAALQAELSESATTLGQAMDRVESLEDKALSSASIKDELETKVGELEAKVSELGEEASTADELLTEASRALEAEKLKAEELAQVEPTELEAQVAKLKKELADALNKLSGKAHGPCCEKTVRLIVRGENLSGAKHSRYLRKLELLNKVK